MSSLIRTRLMLPVLAIAIASSAFMAPSASAAMTSHTIKCKPLFTAPNSANPLCSGTGAIGSVVTSSTYSGRSLAVSMVWRYDSASAMRVWNDGAIKVRCKSTTPGSKAVAYKVASKSIYQNLRVGANISYWRGGLRLRATCPSGFKAASFSTLGRIRLHSGPSIPVAVFT